MQQDYLSINSDNNTVYLLAAVRIIEVQYVESTNEAKQCNKLSSHNIHELLCDMIVKCDRISQSSIIH